MDEKVGKSNRKLLKKQTISERAVFPIALMKKGLRPRIGDSRSPGAPVFPIALMKKGLRPYLGADDASTVRFSDRPDEEGIKTTISHTPSICMVFPIALMKKGLRRQDDDLERQSEVFPIALMKKGLRPHAGAWSVTPAGFSDRPDEEGIKTPRSRGLSFP